MTDTTAELRTRIAEAIADHSLAWSPTGDACNCGWTGWNGDSHVADAVLPVVASEVDALQEKLAHALVHWNYLIKATDSMMAERDAALADLSALRVAVGQLADELADEAQLASNSARSMREASYEVQAIVQRDAERRLRSLLDDKEKQR